MSSLYSEMHDNRWCMNELPSRKHEGEFYYCGQRIPRDRTICSECEKQYELIVFKMNKERNELRLQKIYIDWCIRYKKFQQGAALEEMFPHQNKKQKERFLAHHNAGTFVLSKEVKELLSLSLEELTNKLEKVSFLIEEDDNKRKQFQEKLERLNKESRS